MIPSPADGAAEPRADQLPAKVSAGIRGVGQRLF
jgi:hypothetical protein